LADENQGTDEIGRSGQVWSLIRFGILIANPGVVCEICMSLVVNKDLP